MGENGRKSSGAEARLMLPTVDAVVAQARSVLTWAFGAANRVPSGVVTANGDVVAVFAGVSSLALTALCAIDKPFVVV